MIIFPPYNPLDNSTEELKFFVNLPIDERLQFMLVSPITVNINSELVTIPRGSVVDGINKGVVLGSNRCGLMIQLKNMKVIVDDVTYVVRLYSLNISHIARTLRQEVEPVLAHKPHIVKPISPVLVDVSDIYKDQPSLEYHGYYRRSSPRRSPFRSARRIYARSPIKKHWIERRYPYY